MKTTADILEAAKALQEDVKARQAAWASDKANAGKTDAFLCNAVKGMASVVRKLIAQQAQE